MKYGLFFSLASHFLSHSSLTETWKCHSKMADSLMQGTPHTGSASIMGWVFCRCRTKGVSNGSIRHTRPGGSPRLGTRGHAQIRPTVCPQTRNGMETLILQNLTQWHPGLAAPNMGSYSMACVAWTESSRKRGCVRGTMGAAARHQYPQPCYPTGPYPRNDTAQGIAPNTSPSATRGLLIASMGRPRRRTNRSGHGLFHWQRQNTLFSRHPYLTRPPFGICESHQ